MISPDTVVNSTDISYITCMAIDPERMTRKLVSLPNEMLRDIDDFRFRQRIRTESEAIRQLIEAGLGAMGTRGGPRPGGAAGSPRKPASTDKNASSRAKKRQSS